ncbi:MAG: TonB-dependent receptor plug domain-containing protein, partial [Gemmatimonadales bacterium]
MNARRLFAAAAMSARRLLAAAAVILAGSSGAVAQAAPQRPPEQVPRFLRMSADASREPEVINPADNPILSRRIALNLRDVSRGAALREIALTAGLELVYAGDALAAGTVRFQSDNLTVAAALTEVLFGAGVDVAVGSNGSLILVRKPPARNAAVAGAGAARTGERAVELAPITTMAMAESRKTFELQPMMGHLELGVKELAAAPAPLAGDLFRTVQLLPGVETRNDYSSGLNVRGGESDQNLILLDGYPVYNPFHLGGLLGTFMDPMVGKVDLLTGAAPVRYGERLSSVLDVRSADEDRHGMHGAADVSLLAATATVGSALDGGGSWMIGARHTYADVIANAIKPNSLPYGFSDVQGHLSRPVFGHAVLSVTAYDGSDGTSLDQNSGGLDARWTNRVLGATLANVIPERRVVLGVFPADSVALVQRISLTTFDAAAVMASSTFDLRSSVNDARASGAATLFTKSFDQSIGYEISSEHARYSMRAPITSITNFLPQASLDQTLTPVSGWYDALWHASPRLMVD